jgi:AraC-like DNA-binding protein
MNFEDIPESIIRVAGALGGDKIAFGFLFKKLKDEEVTADKVRERIQSNLPLFNSKDIEWPKWQDLFTKAGLGKHLTKERFQKEFEKNMPDIVVVIQEEPSGMTWFYSQLLDLRIKLGVEIAPSRFHAIDKL